MNEYIYLLIPHLCINESLTSHLALVNSLLSLSEIVLALSDPLMYSVDPDLYLVELVSALIEGHTSPDPCTDPAIPCESALTAYKETESNS